jgi:hypothetical protein
MSSILADQKRPIAHIRGDGVGRGFGVSANEFSCAHGAQINFGDLAPYLTYANHPSAKTAILPSFSLCAKLHPKIDSTPSPLPLLVLSLARQKQPIQSKTGTSSGT